jgi:Skp family chaperone for outer membrane proteins
MGRSAVTRLLCGALIALAIAMGAGPARAQPVPPPVIIIVDITQILRESKAAKDIQGQIDQQTSGYSKEVAQQENELQKMRDELERQRTILAPDAFSAKTREFQQRFDALDRNVQAKRQGLQQSFNDAMSKVESAALQIIADIAKERGATLVLAKAAVMFEADGLDITAEAISRLDKKLPAVAVNLGKPEGEDGAAKAKGAAPTPKK